MPVGTSQAERTPRRRLFNVDEYYRLAEVGILRPDDRVELIDGEIVEMTPIGSLHASVVSRLDVELKRLCRNPSMVRVQLPIRLTKQSEPQPDLSVVKARADFYASNHPTATDVLLVVEVADSSPAYDRRVKMAVYASAGIAEAWVVDLVNRSVDVFNDPTPTGYQSLTQFRGGERIGSQTLEYMNLTADDILGQQ